MVRGQPRKATEGWRAARRLTTNEWKSRFSAHHIISLPKLVLPKDHGEKKMTFSRPIIPGIPAYLIISLNLAQGYLHAACAGPHACASECLNGDVRIYLAGRPHRQACRVHLSPPYPPPPQPPPQPRPECARPAPVTTPYRQHGSQWASRSKATPPHGGLEKLAVRGEFGGR